MRRQPLFRIGLAAGIVVVVSIALIRTYWFASAQGSRLAYGDTVSGTIDEVGEVDTWLFDGLREDVVTVRVSRAGDGLVPVITLTDSDGVLLVSLDWPEQGPAVAEFTASLRLSGVHTLAVGGSGDTVGAYSLSLELQQAASSASFEDGIIVYGRTVSGEISDTTFRQFWAFRGSSGDVIDVAMQATSGDLDAFVSLISPDGDVLITADTGGVGQDAALLAVKLPSAGTYTIAARRAGNDLGESGTTQGSYDLTLTLRTPGLEAGQSTPITVSPGREMRGRLTADAPVALYSVETSGVLSLGLELAEPDRLGTVTVMTPAQALLGVFSGTTPLRASVVLPAAGAVWVEVSVPGISDQPVDYALVVDHLTMAAGTSRPLHYGRTQSSALEPATVEAWHFAGQFGDLVRIHVQPSGPVLNGTLKVHAPDGTLLVQRTIENGVEHALSLDSGGLYEIFVEPSVTSGGYQIGVDLDGVAGRSFDQRAIPQEKGPFPSGIGSAASGELAAFSSESWTLDVSAAQWWQFEVEQQSSAAPVGLAVEAPDGSTLDVVLTNDLTRATRTQVFLSQTGRYRLVVFDPSGSGTHPYTLRGEITEGGALALNTPSKGVLLADRPFDEWWIDVLPDALLNVQLEMLSNSSPPEVYVLNPAGRLAAASSQIDQPGAPALSGIPTAQGGRFRVMVVERDAAGQTVYRVSASVVTPYAASPLVQSSANEPVAEVFVVPAVPAPGNRRVLVADEIVTPITPESEFLVEARRIDVESLVRGEIAPGSQAQAWTFAASSGQMLGFSVVVLDGSGHPGIRLLDQAAAVLAEKFENEGRTSDLTYRFASGGFYTVVVSLNQGQRYTLWIDPLHDVDETVSQVVDGRPLAYGDTLLDEITQPGDRRVFAFYGHAGDVIVANAAEIGGDLRLAMTLAGITGGVLKEVAANDAGLSVELGDFSLPDDGLYQIVVRSDSLDYGAFAIHLNLKTAGAALKQGGGRLAGEVLAGLSADDAEHHWLFWGQPGESVAVKLEPLTPGGPASLELKLADSAGHVFLRKPARLGHGSIQMEGILLPRQGVYQVIVSGGQRQSGLYRLSLVHSLESAQDIERTISYGETVGKVLTSENFLDVWTLAGSAGDSVSIRARRVRGDAALLTLQLRTCDGQVLATAGGEEIVEGTALENIVLPSSSHYSIIVGNPAQSFDGAMAYELTVRLDNSPASSMGSVLAYGETVEGSFYVDDPSDTWLFEGRAGDVVTLSASSQSLGELPSLSLLSTDWHTASQTGQAEVLASAQAVEGQPAQMDVMLPVSAPYAIAVKNTSGGGANYELSLVLQTAALPAVGIVRPDQPRSGEIGSAMPAQTWSFTGTRDTTVSFTGTPDSRSDLAPMVTLSTVEGMVLARAQAPVGQVAQLAAYRLAMDGTYLVSVSRALASEGRTGGRYELLMQQSPVSTLGQQTTLYGKRQIGLLNGSTPVERWSFEGQQGDTVDISVQATSGDLDPVVSLLDSAGTLIASNDDQQGVNAGLHLALPQDGTYVVEAQRYHGTQGTTSGNYTLAVDLVYRPGSAAVEPWLVYGDRVIGMVDGDTPSGQWTFTGETGDVVYVDLQFALDDSPLLLSLSDPAGNVLAEGERDRGDSIIDSFTLPARGSYILQVLRPGDARAAYSPYSLELELLDARPQALAQGGILALDQPVTGQFVTSPATHLWTFQSEAGQGAALSLTRLRALLSAQVTLIAPDGSPVTTLSSAPGSTNGLATGSLTLPLSGVYTVLVSGDVRALGLTYRLWLQPAAPVQSTAQQITSLQDGFGTLDQLLPQAAWSFEAEAGERLSLRVGTVAGDLEPTLMLWGPDNRPLMKGILENSQASLSEFVAPRTGTYRAVVGRVGGTAGSTTGSYRLMLRRQWISERAAAATDVPLGVSRSGMLTRTAPHLYAFQGAAGDVIGLAVRVDGGPVPDMRLETEAGIEVSVPVTRFEAEADIPAFTLPADGRYVVVLESDEPVNYEFNVFRREPEVVTGSLVRSLGRGQAFVEAVQVSGQTTHWNFSGQSGEVLLFTVDTSQSGLRADLALYGPHGYLSSITAEPDSYLVTLGPVRLPDTGDYQLLVGAWLGTAGDTSGAYSVRVQAAEEGESGSAGGYIPVLNSVVNGGLTPEDAQDLWTFDGQAGTVVTVRADQQPGQGSLVLKLTGPDGSGLGVSQPGSGYLGAEISLLTLPVTGVYSVSVEGGIAGDAPLEYRLAVIQSQNALVASMASAQGIAYGDQPMGTFQPGSSRQAWVFFGQAGEQVAGKVDPDGDTLALSLYLVAPDGRIVVANAGAVPGHAVELGGVVLPQSGFYGLIVARSGDLGTSEAYGLTLWRVAGGALAQGTLDEQASGWLTDAAPVHEWVVTPAYSGDYLIQLQPLSPGEQLDLFVESAAGQLLSTGGLADQNTVAARARLESGQQYTIVVSGGPVIAQGQYMLSRQPAHAEAASETLAVGVPNIGRITDEHLADEWQIETAAGTLTVAVTPVSGDLIPFVAVYDADDLLVRQQLAESSSPLEMEVQFPADGVYRILVSRAQGGAGMTEGDYTIVVRP